VGEVGVFSEECEAYKYVCALVPRLCPRLVPSPLWGVNLAKLARMSIIEAESLCPNCSSIIVELRGFWRRLERGVCSVCNERGFHVDEEWRYFLLRSGEPVCDVFSLKDTRGVKGVAYLAELRVLCEKCHLAKHLGYASKTGRLSEALRHLASINRVEEVDAKIVLHLALETWKILSNVREWSIRIGEISLSVELKERAERLLNTLYEKTLHRSKTIFNYTEK
jgi:hypothetical protein